MSCAQTGVVWMARARKKINFGSAVACARQTQPRAAAFGARLCVEILSELFAHDHRIGLAVTPLEIGQHAFERMLAVVAAPALAGVEKTDLLAAGPVQDRVLYGSDFPNIPYAVQSGVEAILDLRLGRALEEKLLCTNAARLFGLNPAEFAIENEP